MARKVMQKGLAKDIKQQNIYSRVCIGNLIGFVIFLMAMYALLLAHSHTFLALSTILNHIDMLAGKNKIVYLGLVPIYLSVMIFGGGFLGWVIGGKIQNKIFTKKGENADISA